MGMKQSWFCDVMTINAKDPELYRPKNSASPASGSGASPAVFVDIEPDGVMGEFAEHIGEYAEWNINAWLFRKPAELKGCLVYNAELDTFHFCNGTDLTYPVATGELPPARSTEKDPKTGEDKEPAKQPGEATKDRGFEQRKKDAAEREKAAKEQAGKAKDAKEKEKHGAAKGKSHETEDEREAREAREAKEKHAGAKSPFDRR